MIKSPRRRSGGARPKLALPEPAAVLAALADPVIVLDRDGEIRMVNPAAEQFFGTGAAALQGTALAGLVAPHSPLLSLIDAVWRVGNTMSEYDIALEGPRFGNRTVTVQAAPLAGEAADLVVLSLHERSMVDKLDRQLTHRNAARSITAMAAMLAHEVKNPLSGIRGAAQLLEQDADEGERQLTRLICDETDRIVALVDRMESSPTITRSCARQSISTRCWSASVSWRSPVSLAMPGLSRSTIRHCRWCTATTTSSSKYS